MVETHPAANLPTVDLRRSTILGIVAALVFGSLVFGFAVFRTFTRDQVFFSESTIRLQFRVPDEDPLRPINLSVLLTEREILRSDAVLTRAVESLYATSSAPALSEVIPALRDSFEVTPMPKPGLLLVRSQGDTPREAAAKCKAVAEAYYSWRVAQRAPPKPPPLHVEFIPPTRPVGISEYPNHRTDLLCGALAAVLLGVAAGMMSAGRALRGFAQTRECSGYFYHISIIILLLVLGTTILVSPSQLPFGMAVALVAAVVGGGVAELQAFSRRFYPKAGRVCFYAVASVFLFVLALETVAKWAGPRCYTGTAVVSVGDRRSHPRSDTQEAVARTDAPRAEGRQVRILQEALRPQVARRSGWQDVEAAQRALMFAGLTGIGVAGATFFSRDRRQLRLLTEATGGAMLMAVIPLWLTSALDITGPFAWASFLLFLFLLATSVGVFTCALTIWRAENTEAFLKSKMR